DQLLWHAREVEFSESGTRFRAFRSGEEWGTIETPLAGAFNVRVGPHPRTPGRDRASAGDGPGLTTGTLERSRLGEMERCPPGSDDPAGVHSWKHAGVAQSGSASDL